MNCLVPFKTHPPSTLSALVLRAAASEPEPGSVSPQAPRASPEASLGKKTSFCLSLPARRMCPVARELWLATVRARAPS